VLEIMNNIKHLSDKIIKEEGHHTFSVGDKVTYIPTHAKGNAGHPDCEGGVITKITDHCIFVEYGTGTPQGTRKEDLVRG